MVLQIKAQGMVEFSIIAVVIAIAVYLFAGSISEYTKLLFNNVSVSSNSQTVVKQVDNAFEHTKILQKAGFDLAKTADENLSEAMSVLSRFVDDPRNQFDISEMANSIADAVSMVNEMPEGSEKEVFKARLAQLMREIGSEKLFDKCIEDIKVCKSAVSDQIKDLNVDALTEATNQSNKVLTDLQGKILLEQQETLPALEKLVESIKSYDYSLNSLRDKYASEKKYRDKKSDRCDIFHPISCAKAWWHDTFVLPPLKSSVKKMEKTLKSLEAEKDDVSGAYEEVMADLEEQEKEALKKLEEYKDLLKNFGINI